MTPVNVNKHRTYTNLLHIFLENAAERLSNIPHLQLVATLFFCEISTSENCKSRRNCVSETCHVIS